MVAAMPPWAAIVRVSHMGDRREGDADFHSDREQLEAVRAVLPPGDSLVVLPAELGVSGGLPLAQRPALLKAVVGVEQGQYAGIIVAYQSRLFRNVEEEEAVWRRVEAAGGEVLLALDGVDNKTVSGRMVRRIKAAINHAEREHHIERFENLRRWATEAGIWQRRQTPRGYTRDPFTRKLVPDDQADEVRWAFRARARGAATTAIARRLNMTPNGVRGLLRNRVYLGELKVGQHVNPAAHPRIVTEDEFLAAQQVAAPRPPRKHATPALLAGLVRCRSCGHIMTRGRSGTTVVYSCPRYHSAGECPGPSTITCQRLDRHVTDIAVSYLAMLRARASFDETRITEARERRGNARRELAAYLQAVEAAGIGAVDFAAGAKQRQQAVDDAEGELGVALAARPDHLTGDPVEAWNQAGVERRNHLLRSLAETVIVRQPRGHQVIPVSDRARVIAIGADIVEPYRGGGVPVPVRELPFPGLDDPRILRVQLG